MQVPYSICVKAQKTGYNGDIRKDIGEILRKLCEHKKVEITEAEVCKGHTHMPVSIPPNLICGVFERKK